MLRARLLLLCVHVHDRVLLLGASEGGETTVVKLRGDARAARPAVECDGGLVRVRHRQRSARRLHRAGDVQQLLVLQDTTALPVGQRGEHAHGGRGGRHVHVDACRHGGARSDRPSELDRCAGGAFVAGLLCIGRRQGGCDVRDRLQREQPVARWCEHAVCRRLGALQSATSGPAPDTARPAHASASGPAIPSSSATTTVTTTA